MGRTATLGTLSLKLVSWMAPGERYQDVYRPVDPNLKFLPNDPTRLVAEQGAAYWAVRDWGAGEGEDRWNPDNPGFHVSSNVTRKRTGKGLVLGPAQTACFDSTGAATFNDGRRFGYGLGSLWTADNANGYPWDVTNSKWGTAVPTGGGANTVTSMTDGDDTYMYCADEATQALTKRGWVNQDEIIDSDQVLSIDPETQNISWQPIQRINRFHFDGSLNRWRSKRMDALVTDDHRWMTDNDGKPPRRRFRATKELLGISSSIRVQVSGGTPTEFAAEATVPDEMVETVGWVVTEGYLHPSGGIFVAQSPTHNPAYCDRIDTLAEWFRGQGYHVKNSYQPSNGTNYWYFGAAAARFIKQYAPDKQITVEFLNHLTEPQAQLLYSTLIDGDGRRRASRQGTGVVMEYWAQKDRGRLDGFQALCAMLGKRTHERFREEAACSTVSVYRSSHTLARAKHFTQERYKGIVWCPTVATGTWMARRNGVTYWTGNSGFNNLTIRRWKTGTQASHYATATGDDFTYDPVLRSFDGTLYALDGDDLYEIDKSVANTRTLKVDVTGSSAVYLAAEPWCYNRMSVSDVGPIWLQRLDNGQTFIWQYNVYQDVGQIVGKLPSDFAFPYSLMFAAGFIFVAYREADAHATSGNAHIYFQRGAQRGVLPLIRSTTGTTASKPVLIAGVDGDDLVFYYDGATWVYNFTDGGLFMLGAATTTGTPQDAITLGASTFISPVTSGGNTAAVERFDRLNYTTGTATVESGQYDFTYFDIPKILTTLTVITEPLPANTLVSAAYQLDSGSWVALTGDHDVDGATSKSWTVSDNATTARGSNFGIRLTLNTTATGSTPTVRGWTARAVTAAHSRSISMVVDVSTYSDTQDTVTLVSGLRSLVESQDVVSLSLPFEVDEHDAVETFDVRVRSVMVLDAQKPASRLHAVVEVEKLELVVA